MAENHLSEKIREFILEKFPLARKQQLKNSDALLESGILDSLGILDLVNYIEQQFSIGVSDDELIPENFQTVDRIAAFVESKSTHAI
ncbi:MAG TPA: phosphopantetheine-binding protein [Candidatus Acidoferrum sp.]|jgi:acyl carrier protein